MGWLGMAEGPTHVCASKRSKVRRWEKGVFLCLHCMACVYYCCYTHCLHSIQDLGCVGSSYRFNLRGRVHESLRVSVIGAICTTGTPVVERRIGRRAVFRNVWSSTTFVLSGNSTGMFESRAEARGGRNNTEERHEVGEAVFMPLIWHRKEDAQR